MPLQYIIDAYNIINHITFNPLRRKTKDPQRALMEFIKDRRLAKGSKNKVLVVFDGYPYISAQKLEATGIEVIFSKEETADTRIKRIAETLKNPRDTVVVSDDREIKFFVKSVGCRAIGVEEFIKPEQKQKQDKEDLIKPELNYSQISMINEELKALWLKR